MMLRHGFLLALAGFLLTLPALAQTRSSSVYTVTDVAVDATAQSAVQAREIARADGERRAFRTLMERLTPKQDWSRLPKVTDSDLFALVQDFEVTSERSSTVRYLATLTFRFRAEPVRRLLRDRGIAFAETPSKPLVVLPVFSAGNRAVLWEDPNPWRAAWGHQSAREGLVPVQVPAGDLAAVQAIDTQQALKRDKDALAAIGRRYENADVVVSQAALSGSGDQRTLLRPELDECGQVRPEGERRRFLRARGGRGDRGRLRRLEEGNAPAGRLGGDAHGHGPHEQPQGLGGGARSPAGRAVDPAVDPAVAEPGGGARRDPLPRRSPAAAAGAVAARPRARAGRRRLDAERQKHWPVAKQEPDPPLSLP